MQQFIQFITDIYLQLNCFGHPHAHHQELNNCSSGLWFYHWSVVIAVLLVVVRPVMGNWSVTHSNSPLPARPQTTALLSPRSNGKTRGRYCSC
jgi:hypothetical protein